MELKTELAEITDYVKLLYDCMRKEYEDPREGVHLSDLIHCPRQSYFKSILGVKHNDRTLCYFFDGAGIHMILQKLFGKYHHDRFKIESTRKINDVLSFTPDVIDTETNTILEIKTARSPVINYSPRPDHVEQLKAYMAFCYIEKGVVFYHLITKEQNNLFTQWPIFLSKTDAAKIREHWLDEAQSLQFAIRMNDKTLARHIADNPAKNWMCGNYCDYTQYCDEGKAAVKRKIEASMSAPSYRPKRPYTRKVL